MLVTKTSKADDPKGVAWNREAHIRAIKSRIWTHLSPTSVEADEIELEAAALLQMSPSAIRRLGQLHFLMSDEVGALLTELPRLMRVLPSTTISEEEWNYDKLRGPVNWPRTRSLRASLGERSLFVTSPARRVYQTPEGLMLRTILDAIEEEGKRTRWVRDPTGSARGDQSDIEAAASLSSEITKRVSTAKRWSRHRSILDIQPRPLRPQEIARVATGRRRRSFRTVISAYERYRTLIKRADPTEIRRAVEDRALVVPDNAVLFEISCTFAVIESLERLGWRRLSPLALFGDGEELEYRAQLDGTGQRLTLWYQASPAKKSRLPSNYVQIQRKHWGSRSTNDLRPDLVIRYTSREVQRWLVVEMKMGKKRHIFGYGRLALFDLLAYRHAFQATLGGQPAPFGLGIVLGEGLAPKTSEEVMLCTPDRIDDALIILAD